MFPNYRWQALSVMKGKKTLKKTEEMEKDQQTVLDCYVNTRLLIRNVRL